MVVVVSANDIDVQCHACCLSKGLEDVRDHLGAEVSNFLPF